MTLLVARPSSVSARSALDPAEPAIPQGRRCMVDEAGFWMVLAGLALSCFAGHWGDLGLRLPLDRGLLIAGLLWEWRRGLRSRTLPRLTGTAALLIAAATWGTVSFIGSPVRDGTGAFLLLDLLVIPAVLFISAPLLFADPHRRFLLSAVFTVFGIYLGATAVTQTAHLGVLVQPAYILDPTVGIHADRARGPYAEAVANGIMLVFSGVLGARLAATTASAGWRAAGTAAAVLAAVGCALTLTRAVWFAGIAVLVIGLVAVPGLRRRLPLVLVGLAVAGAVFLAAFPDFLAAATDRGGDQSPIWDRLNVNAGAARMALANPLFGVGWNQAGTRMVEYVRLGADYPVTAASAGLIPHNVFLGRFAELGIPGAVLWLAAAVAALILPIVRRGRPGFGGWRLALLAFVVCWLIVANFGPVNYSEPAYLLYLVGGIAASGRAAMPAPHDWRPRGDVRGAHRG